MTKDGFIMFGEVKGMTKDKVAFSEYTPTAKIANLDKSNIIEFEPYEEEDIPPYE